MDLVTPKIVMLDSSTLGKLSLDYWCTDNRLREKSRAFLYQLRDQGCFIAFTLTHVIELLRHSSRSIVQDRLRFLRSLPLIAWMRPYDGNWFPGGAPDLLRYELHAVVHGSARNWRAIVDEVRPTLWETGMGSELFLENDEFWSTLKQEAHRQHEVEKYVASVARTDPGRAMNIRLADALRLPIRPKEDREAYMRRFAEDMQKQLDQHGDKRFDQSHEAAMDFADGALNNVADFEANGGDSVLGLLNNIGVPLELISPEMTIGEIGLLGVYAKQLSILSKRLRPPVILTAKDIPPDTLPSKVLEASLASIQRRASRVSGSDLGDGHIAPVVFYADAVEVDKRTFEYLKQVQRSQSQLSSLFRPFFRTSDYVEIPGKVGVA